MYDLLIKNGAIIDGTGSPAFHGDIAVKDGKIVRIARNIREESRETIDADGLTVTPGFIDSHSHSDNALFAYPDMVEKIEQGITTSVGGQCGGSVAPTKSGDTCRTFSSIAKEANALSLGSNLITFVGHGAIRRCVMGNDNRKPTEEEMEKMKALLRDAMENGALGLSFGLIYTPSCYADTEELLELARVVKEYDGMLSAHIRDEKFALVGAVEEFLSVIKAVGVKAVFSHHKAMHRENWGKVNHTLRMLDEAAKEGYDVYCDVYPYIASSTDLISTIVDKRFRSTDKAGVVKLLSDPEMRRKVREVYCTRLGESLNNLMLTSCKNHPEYAGRIIDDIAKERGEDPFECAAKIIIECEGFASVCNFGMCEEDVETVIKYERSMICTDSSVARGNTSFHPRLKASFPRAIGKYVRERGVVSLHEMIRKCTSMPASVYGLSTKGILREGFDADICIFDAERIIDCATFIDCTKRCEGLNFVILGGEVVAENAVYNGKRNGKFIKRSR